VESLTGEIEKRAGEYIAKIDQIGGAVAAIERGYIQQEVQESSYRFQKEIESRKRVMVGGEQVSDPRTAGEGAAESRSSGSGASGEAHQGVKILAGCQEGSNVFGEAEECGPGR